MTGAEMMQRFFETLAWTLVGYYGVIGVWFVIALIVDRRK